MRGWNSLYESWLSPNSLAWRSAFCANSGAPTFRACCGGTEGAADRRRALRGRTLCIVHDVLHVHCLCNTQHALPPRRKAHRRRLRGCLHTSLPALPPTQCSALRLPSPPTPPHPSTPPLPPHVDQDLAGLVAEGLVLLQLAARQVVEARQLEGLVQVVGRLAAAVQLLQVALLCTDGRSRRGSREEGGRRQVQAAAQAGRSNQDAGPEPTPRRCCARRRPKHALTGPECWIWCTRILTASWADTLGLSNHSGAGPAASGAAAAGARKAASGHSSGQTVATGRRLGGTPTAAPEASARQDGRRGSRRRCIAHDHAQRGRQSASARKRALAEPPTPTPRTTRGLCRSRRRVLLRRQHVVAHAPYVLSLQAAQERQERRLLQHGGLATRSTDEG